MVVYPIMNGVPNPNPGRAGALHAAPPQQHSLPQTAISTLEFIVHSLPNYPNLP